LDVNVVVLNWNARLDTVSCVERLQDWARPRPRVWVVDNGSKPEESVNQRMLPAASILRSETNVGFSGGSNLAFRRILRESGSPVLLLNNDVRIEELDARHLLGTLSAEPRCGVAGPVIVSASDPRTVVSAGSRNLLLRRDPGLRRVPSETTEEVDYVSGAAVVIRSEVLRRVGLFDESYFFALELADLCRRARKAGFVCLVDGSARAEHDLERSSELRGSLYAYYAARNRLLYARRALPLLWPAPVLLWAAHGLQQGGRLWLQRRRATATAILLGMRDGLRGRFGNRNESVLAACRRQTHGAVE
jgi:GT2 family glycosyltransferase